MKYSLPPLKEVELPQQVYVQLNLWIRQSLIDFVFISKKSLFKGKVLSIIFRTDTDFDVQSATESLNFKSILKKHGLLILYYEHLPFERQVTNQPYSYIEMLPHQAVYFREVNAFEKWMQYWKGISVQNINQSLNQTVSYKENFLRETEYRLKKTAYAPEFEVIKAADLRKHLVNILLPFQKYLLYEGSQLQLLSNTEVLHFLYDNHRLFRQCVEEESPNALESLLLLISFNTENPQTYVPDTIPFLKCSKILSFLVWILVVDAPVGYKKKCKNALKSYHSFLEYQQGKRDALENETQQAKVKTLVVQSILKVTTVYGLCCLGSKSITVTGSVNPLMHESGHELLLLLIAPKITGELEDRIRNSIAVASNNSIKVTFILLKQNSVGKHFSYYHNFFENTILNTETAQVWQPIALKNNTLMLDAMRHNLKELQQQYWQESCRLMQPQWELLNNLTTIQWKQSHLLQLRFLLQQTVLNLLFVKIGIIPSIHHLSYLKRLLTWYAPEVSSNIKLTTAIESVLFASRNDTCVFPQLQYPIEELHTDIVHEAYTFCKDIFDFTNTLYTSTNSSQTTHP